MPSVRCGYCGKPHPLSLCPSTWAGSTTRAHLRCTYCGSRQHTASYCPKTHGGCGNRLRNPSGEYLDR